MKQLRFILIALVLILLVSCTGNDQPTSVPQPASTEQTAVSPTPTLASAGPTTAVQPTDPPATLAALPTETTLPAPTADSQDSQSTAAPTPIPLTGQDAIQIEEPGPGWRLTSPIHVSGMADPTFEQNLVVQLLADDGSQLALVPVTIAAEAGQRGPFSVDIPISVSGERQVFLQVFTTSARDGGITHLSSVGFTLAESGPENRPSFTPFPERIIIARPTLNTAVSGGTVHVEGTALASFEATLVVDVLDESGVVIGSQPILVQSPDIGLPGPFSADIPYSGSPTGAGRVVIRDLSPAFGGEVHLASVEIRFE